MLDRTLLEALEDFKTALISVGCSERTVRCYVAAVKDFVRYAGNIKVGEVTQGAVQRWVAYRLNPARADEKKGGRLTTLHYYTMFLRRFLRWAGKTDVYVPIVKRAWRKEPQVLSENDFRALLNACKDDKEKLIVALLFETGVRASELLTIRARDVNLLEREIRLRGSKYGKERVVYIGPLSFEILKRYMAGLKPGDRLVSLSYSGLYKKVKSIAKRAGLDVSSIRPHVFRHTFATESLRRGVNLIALQRILGHSDIKTTQVYLHLLAEDVKRAYERAFYNSADTSASNRSRQQTRAMESEVSGEAHHSALIRYCPMCGAEVLPAGARFCVRCGFALYTIGSKTVLGPGPA